MKNINRIILEMYTTLKEFLMCPVYFVIWLFAEEEGDVKQ